MPFRGGIFMPVSGRYFHAVSGRYFHAASGRRNGKTAAPVRRPQARGAGCRGRRYSHAVLRRYFHARYGAIFCPLRGGVFMPFRGGIFMPFRGGVFMSVMGGETAKRPRRCAARKQGARAAEGGRIFQRGVAREQGARAVGREDRISRRSGAPPVHKGRGCRGRGDILMPLRGGETAKRPRRGAARKQGARAAGGGDMIFRAASPASGPLSAKKAKKSRKIALHSFDIS